MATLPLPDAIYALPGASFQSTVDGAATGLTGTMNVRIENTANQIITAARTSGITEIGVGVYTATLVAPNPLGNYVVIWNDGTAGPEAADSLVVTTNIPGPASYDITTDIGKVRFEISDTVPATPFFSDAEIQYKLTEANGQILVTAANLCDVLATRLAGDYDFKWMDQSFSRSQASKAYAARAQSIRERAPGGGLAVVGTTRVDGYSQDVDNRSVVVAGKYGRQQFRDRFYR